MRDNGLNAASWVLLADLDPRVADAALDALRTAGVAAYTNPHPGIRRAYLDVSPMPRPTDQLYVDAAARERAEAVLLDLQEEAQVDPGEQPSGLAYDPAEVDAEFARIIAGMDGPLPDGGEPPTEHRETEGERGSPSTTTTTGWEIVGSARHDVEEEEPAEAADDEHFVPPPPPPVPRGDAISRFAWLGLIGAPVVTLLCVLMSWRLEGWQALLVAGAFIGGFATLVIRMGNGDDEDPDGGAVV
jgi:hypothetical protein